MAHHIVALIAKGPINEAKAKSFDLPVFSENKYVVLGLDSAHSDFWSEKLGFPYTSGDSVVSLDVPVIHHFAKEIGIEEYALIETDYFGGVGEQFAIYYKNEKAIHSSTAKNSICIVLKALGVETLKNDYDEFETVGLHRYRTFEDYFAKYWNDL
jgi:hypothetical protein